MRFFHKNTPFTPTLIEKGNSVILYNSKSRVSVPNSNTTFVEIKVKDKTFLVEYRVVEGLEIASLNTNQGNYQFLLKEAGNREPTIILNPNQRWVDVKGVHPLFYLPKETPTKKDTGKEIPDTFWNYETNKLVYNAVTPLSSQLVEQNQLQQNLIENHYQQISDTVKKQKIILEKSLADNFEKLSKEHQEALVKGWNNLQQLTLENVKTNLKIVDKQLSSKLADELKKYTESVISEEFDVQKDIMHKDAVSLVESLSAQTAEWLKEQVYSINRKAVELINETHEAKEFLLTEKTNTANSLVKTEFENLQLALDNRFQNLHVEIDKSVSNADQIISEKASALGLLLDNTPKQIDELIQGITSKWKDRVDKEVIKLEKNNELIESLKDRIDQSNNEFTDQLKNLKDTIFEALENKVENQKKETNTELKKFVELKISELKTLVMRAMEAGGGGGGSVAEQLFDGGIIYGNLVINDGNLSINNGNLTVTGYISSGGVIYASGGNSDLWNAASTTYQNLSGDYATRSFAVAMSVALG